MTETIIVALISSFATLAGVFIKLALDKQKNKKIGRITKILLEDLNAKKAIIILKEDDSDFDFESRSSTEELPNNFFRFKVGEASAFFEIQLNNDMILTKGDREKIKKYTNFLNKNLSEL
jgi:hypothetical protein